MSLAVPPIADNPPIAIAAIVTLFWAWAIGTCRPNARAKRRSVRFWTVAALMLGPLAVLWLNLLPAIPTETAEAIGIEGDPVT